MPVAALMALTLWPRRLMAMGLSQEESKQRFLNRPSVETPFMASAGDEGIAPTVWTIPFFCKHFYFETVSFCVCGISFHILSPMRKVVMLERISGLFVSDRDKIENPGIAHSENMRTVHNSNWFCLSGL